jgi:integrase
MWGGQSCHSSTVKSGPRHHGGAPRPRRQPIRDENDHDRFFHANDVRDIQFAELMPRRLSNTWWNVARRKAGIDDLHFHDLRHEFGSQLLEAGGELHEVQATLGHTNIKMTSTYLNATTQGVKQAFKKLEAKRRRNGLRVVAR